MRASIVSVAIVTGFVLLTGCAAQPADDAAASLTSESALSSTGKVVVGTYHSADGALYPTFTLQSDGTYRWDTGIRCVKAPCPSGDIGTWSVYASGATKYVDLTSNDRTIADRWFKLASTSPVTLKGAFGTTGTFTQGKTCGADDWLTIVNPTLAQVDGGWSRHDQVGITVTDETLRLHGDSTYQLTKTIGPGCDASGTCAKFVTRIETSTGTFALNPGQGVQLVPSATPSDDLALSWILEQACGASTYRLTSTETGVDVHLASIGQCSVDADCVAADAPPSTLLCSRGLTRHVTCNVSTHACKTVCAR
jgi:hypothetical protein